MTEEHAPENEAADAFERVGDELSLLRSAIKGLTAARENTPDYSATLGEMVQALNLVHARLQQIEQSRALSLSPVALADEINAATASARAQDQKVLVDARDALVRSLGQVDGMIGRGKSIGGRARRERWIAVAGMLVGILLWSILPGAIVRSLPESWHAPEWMAARMMGMDQAHAGKRMMETAKTDGP